MHNLSAGDVPASTVDSFRKYALIGATAAATGVVCIAVERAFRFESDLARQNSLRLGALITHKNPQRRIAADNRARAREIPGGYRADASRPFSERETHTGLSWGRFRAVVLVSDRRLRKASSFAARHIYRVARYFSASFVRHCQVVRFAVERILRASERASDWTRGESLLAESRDLYWLGYTVDE